MAGHPAFGSALVDPLRPWLGDALSAVDGHHERFDGTGYPYRRPSGSLPVAARVAAVADAFETMTAARSYKDPMPLAAARAEVAACAGGQFDPAVCRAFLALSLPRLWRVAGPLSWLAQIPLIGAVVRGEIVPVVVSSAAQGAALATGQAVTAAAVVGGALLVGGAAGHGVGPTPGNTCGPGRDRRRPTVTDPAGGSTDPDDSGTTMDPTGAGEAGRTAPGPVLPAPEATIPRFRTRPVPRGEVPGPGYGRSVTTIRWRWRGGGGCGRSGGRRSGRRGRWARWWRRCGGRRGRSGGGCRGRCGRRVAGRQREQRWQREWGQRQRGRRGWGQRQRRRPPGWPARRRPPRPGLRRGPTVGT